MASAGKTGPMFATTIAQLVMTWMLGGVIAHFGAGQATLMSGLLSGFFLWFGFSLTVIDGIHWLGTLLIQGAVIGSMGV